MKQNDKPLPAFAKLVKGYLGFLTGTGKSGSTISSYKGDLDLLEAYLREKKKTFYALNAKDFSTYQIWLEQQGLKTNTRRRKVLSAKALVKYAVSRKKMKASAVQFVKAPERLERLPWIPLGHDWVKILATLLPANSTLGLRNLLVTRLLGETGLAVAELCELRWENVQGDEIEAGGKKARKLKISAETAVRLAEWRALSKGKFLFPGFNRHGITSERMTPRGVELFFKTLGRNSGHKNLKPKTLRHFAIATWLKDNVAEGEIQRRLGVHPNYSLDAYRKHLEIR
jgi:integrase/recombinase XerC